MKQTQEMTMITFEQYLKEVIKLRFRRKVQIKFDDKGNPSLVFADGIWKSTKQAAIALVEEAYREEGGEVRFFPDQEVEVAEMPE